MEQTTGSGRGTTLKWGLVALAVVLLALAACGPKEEPPPVELDLDGFTVAALQEDADGMPTTGGFTITAVEPVTGAQLQQMVALEPAAELRVEGSNGSFTVTPAQELKSNTVYNLKLQNGDEVRRFAFQTKTDFALEYQFPTGEYVPVETGIELRFSGGRPANLAENFSISPAVAGSFQEIRSTFVFVPEQPLVSGTEYTVTLSAELASEGGALLGEAVSFSFVTRVDTSLAVVRLAAPVMETFTSDRTPLIELHGSAEGGYGSFDLEVLRYSDQAAFVAAMRTLHEDAAAQLPVEGLAAVATFSQEVLTYDSDQYARRCFFMLQEPLPTGYYLVRATGTRPDSGQPYTLQKLIQIHDTAVAAIAAGGNYLVWANNAATGQPVSGASVYLNGYSKAMTDGDGLAMFATGDIDPGEFNSITVESGGSPFVVDLVPQAAVEAAGSQRYYAALYSDREVYLPTDTIRLWGVVQPRVGSVGPREVVVRLGDVEQRLPVGEFGSFEATFEIERYASAYHQITLVVEGVETAWRYVQVLDYDKPIYDGALELDRKVYFPGETAELNGTVRFYDGTVVDSMELELYCSLESARDSSLTVTAQEGAFSVSLAVPDYNRDYWQPRELYYRVRNTQAEDGVFERSATAAFYPRDAMVETETAKDGSAVEVSIHAIDRAKARQAGWTHDYDQIRGAPLDRPIEWEVVRHTTVREQIGSHYDFINKVDVPEYRYSYEEETIDRSGAQLTAEGRITIPLEGYQPVEGSRLEVIIHTTDSAGRAIEEPVWVYRGEWYGYMEQRWQSSYSLQRTDYEKWQVALGEQLSFELQRGNAPVTEGRVLLVAVRDTIKSASVHDVSSIGLTYEQQYLPTAALYGFYFDGRDPYQASSPVYLSFDPAERTLEVELTTDKQRYSAGEEVALEVQVTDSGGRPVETQLCVSVVDEAAFAVGNQNYDLPGTLYQWVSPVWADCYVSYIDHLNPWMGAEGGGEGDAEGFRTDFSDNPAFLNLTTDKQGRASVSFKLADSLTSWRITTLAVGEGPTGGKGILNITTGQPFFVNVLSTGRYTLHDDVVVSLRGFGDALERDALVAFACELQREGGAVVGGSQTGNGVKGDYVNFGFGKLEPGSYTLQAVGRSGDYSDALQLPIEVVESLVEVPVLRYLQPEQLADISPERYPVELTLYDTSLRPWLETLYGLAIQQGGRADQQIASALALRLLAQYNGQEDAALPELPTFDYGARLFPYADIDILLTAKVALAAPEAVPGAVSYFENYYHDGGRTSTEVAAAYLGLAALKQPVLRELRALVNTLQPTDDTGFTETDKLLLVAALAAIGDESGAREAYERLVRPSLLSTQDGQLYLNAGGLDDNVEQTALALLTAALAVREDAPALAQYLNKNPSKTVLPALEQAVYVAHTPPSGSDMEVTATIGGQQQTITLRRGLAFLRLDKSQLEGAALAAQENLSLIARYTGAPDQLRDQTGRIATLTRTVEPLRGGGLRRSALVKVTLAVDFSGESESGTYSLVDALPAGLRYVGMGEESWGDYRNRWLLTRADGQHLSFVCYRPGKSNQPLVYYARLVLPGDYLFEAPYLFHAETGAWGTGATQPLVIGP